MLKHCEIPFLIIVLVVGAPSHALPETDAARARNALEAAREACAEKNYAGIDFSTTNHILASSKGLAFEDELRRFLPSANATLRDGIATFLNKPVQASVLKKGGPVSASYSDAPSGMHYRFAIRASREAPIERITVKPILDSGSELYRGTVWFGPDGALGSIHGSSGYGIGFHTNGSLMWFAYPTKSNTLFEVHWSEDGKVKKQVSNRPRNKA